MESVEKSRLTKVIWTAPNLHTAVEVLRQTGRHQSNK